MKSLIASVVLLIVVVNASSDEVPEDSDFLASISLQLSNNDPAEIFSTLRNSLVKNIEILNKDLNSEDCSFSTYQSQLSSLKESQFSLQFTKQRISSSLSPMEQEIQKDEKELSSHRSYKDQYSQILQQEKEYFRNEKYLLEKSLEEIDNATRKASGDNLPNSVVLLEGGEVQQVSDSLKLLNKLKRCIEKSLEVAEEVENESVEKSRALQQAMDQGIEELKEEIANKIQVVGQMQRRAEEIENDLSKNNEEIENIQVILGEKKNICESSRERYQADIQGKERHLDILRRIVDEYEKNSEGAVQALKQGKLP